jgi:hypothetical protein
MVIEALAGTIITILRPYFIKGAEEFAKETGKAAFAKVAELLSALRTKFAGSPEASSALDNFAGKPDRYAPVVEDLIKEQLTADPQFAARLSELVSQLGPDLQIFQKIDKGEEITGLKADEMTSGATATVVQEIKDGKKVVGAEVKKFGR